MLKSILTQNRDPVSEESRNWEGPVKHQHMAPLVPLGSDSETQTFLWPPEGLAETESSCSDAESQHIFTA